MSYLMVTTLVIVGAGAMLTGVMLALHKARHWHDDEDCSKANA